MALREIIVLPDPRLREKSAPVKAVDKEVRKLVEDGVPIAPLPPEPPKKTEVN
jgi:peptide deformylase